MSKNLSYCIKDFISKRIENSSLYTNCELKNSNKINKKLKYVVDFDESWDNLCGNYDWSSGGGEWSLMRRHFNYLNRASETAGVQLIFFFDGTIPKCFDSFEWLNKKKNDHNKVNQFFRSNLAFVKIHPPFINEYIKICIEDINKKTNKNPKNISAYQSAENHQREIIQFCRDNQCDGVLTDDFDLISLLMLEKFDLNLPNIKIYSARSLRYLGPSLKVDMINTSNILNALKMDINQFKWFTFLLSCQTSHFVSGEWILEFYKRVTQYSIIDLNNPSENMYVTLLEELNTFINRFKNPIYYDHMMKCILK